MSLNDSAAGVLSGGTFHFMLYNWAAASNLNMKNASILPLESLLSVHDKPASDHDFVVRDLFFTYFQ